MRSDGRRKGRGKRGRLFLVVFFRKLSFKKNYIMRIDYSWHYECVEERHGLLLGS